MEWRVENQLIDYNLALQTMRTRVDGIINGSADELVWLVEHPSLYTAGVSADPAEINNHLNIPVYNVSRGGKYTYHGPGQRIIYLMLDLKKREPDVKKFVSKIEQWIISTLENFNLKCYRKNGYIGIWCRSNTGVEVKIAAIGIKLKKWVSYHGIAINLNPNLDYFQGIIPCGIKDFGVSSLEALGINIELKQLDEQLFKNFNHFF